MGRQRRVEYNIPVDITSASSTLIRSFGLENAAGAEIPNAVHGALIGVITRWEQASGAGALTACRVKVQSQREGQAVTAATVPAEALCYDSAAMVIASSATVAMQNDMFGGAAGDPQPYTDGFDILADVTVAGGQAVGTLTICVLLDEREQ